MSRLTLSDFKLHFRDVIDSKDRIIVVYSGIWTFGHRLDLPISRIPQALIEAMIEELGVDQNLLLPSYTYSYAGTRQYSPVETIPETGILPASMLKHSKALRSRSALNSFLVAGPDAATIAAIHGDTLWGHGSLKEYFEEQHARIVVLGVPWKDACGFLHRIEEVCDVPYRYHKTFHGTWLGQAGPEAMVGDNVREANGIAAGFSVAACRSTSSKSRGVRGGGGQIHLESIDAADLVQAGIEILSSDRLALLTNREEMGGWIASGKAKEISELRIREPGALDHMSYRLR